MALVINDAGIIWAHATWRVSAILGADEITKGILLFWANHGKKFPTWALAMQIVGSFTPNSAAAERVFSLLKLMFGDAQMSALADMIQAALMLKYNQRKVG